MQINANTAKWGLIAIGTILAGLGTGFVVHRMERDSKSTSTEARNDATPTEDATQMERTAVRNDLQSLRSELPEEAASSSLWDDDTSLDKAGHIRFFYIAESRNLRGELSKAYKRIDEGEYKEAALHIRFVLEKGMEAVIAHNLGNRAIADGISENAERCRQILGSELSDRLFKSCKLLNGVIHGEPFYQDMSKERIMAAYNTANELCAILRSYAD